MAHHITVKDNRTDGRVALWERHPDHPNGEVYIAGGNTVQAGNTPAVRAALREGSLIEVEAPAPAPVEPAPKAKGAKEER